MALEDPVPLSNFETNTTDHGRRKRDRRSSRSAARKPLNTKRADLAGPTPERMAKVDDEPIKTAAGHYRAPPPIERMRDRDQLDEHHPYINEAMFQAAEKLYGFFYTSGLSGIAAQDISKTIHGSGDSPSSIPLNDRAAHCREQFREAVKLLGWSAITPYRGAGRLTVAVVCYEMNVEEAAAIHRPGGNDAARKAKGMEVLREGLFALAVHWKLCR